METNSYVGLIQDNGDADVPAHLCVDLPIAVGSLPVTGIRNDVHGDHRYRALLSMVAGLGGGPIAEVFPHRDSPVPDQLRPKRLPNRTPHDVTLIVAGEPVRTWPKLEPWTRHKEMPTVTDPLAVDGITVPTTDVVHGEVLNAPRPEPEVGFIVPRITAAAAERPDCYVPFEEVRDEAGRIVGCEGLDQIRRKKRSVLTMLDLLKHQRRAATDLSANEGASDV